MYGIDPLDGDEPNFQQVIYRNSCKPYNDKYEALKGIW